MELTDKEKIERFEKSQAIAKRAYKRRQAKIAIVMAKAKKANITASDAEIEAYMKKNP